MVVAGYHDQAIRRFVEGLPTPVRLLTNLNPGDGQLSSLLVALRAVDRPQLRAVIVTLVDLPLVSASTVRAVLDGYRRTGAPLVRPERDGRHGHPVLFDRSLFDELRAADPEHGAKPVVRAHAARGLDVPTEDDGAFTDIDTPQDYERVFDRPLSPGTE